MPVLLVVGIGLLIFGGIILLRYPNRPGGEIAWQGMKVSSSGAGLPVIVLGVVCLAFTNSANLGLPALANLLPGSSASPDLPTGGSGSDCFAAYFQGIPRERLVGLEEGARDVTLVAVDQPKVQAVGITLTQNRVPIGALRVDYFPANELFKVEGVVDSACHEIDEYANMSRGGDKHAVVNWDSLRMRFGDQSYTLQLGDTGTELQAGEFTKFTE